MTTSSASILPGSDPTEPTAMAAIMHPSAAASAARPCNIEVSPPVSLAEIASRSYRDKRHDRPDAPDEDEYLTLPDEIPPGVLLVEY